MPNNIGSSVAQKSAQTAQSFIHRPLGQGVFGNSASTGSPFADFAKGIKGGDMLDGNLSRSGIKKSPGAKQPTNNK